MRVNGVSVDPLDERWSAAGGPDASGARLLDFLRDDLGLTGAKEGCGMGECGSCTVIVDGRAVCSCLVLVGQVADAEIETVEGLAERGGAPLQSAFVARQAVQCGYCIPGVLMSCKALLDHQPDHQPDPTDAEITSALEGNLCRCTGYNRFNDAVHEAACAQVEPVRNSGAQP